MKKLNSRVKPFSFDLFRTFFHKTVIFLFLFSISYNSNISAQLPTLDWAKQFAIISNPSRFNSAETESLKLDSSGNIITAGYFSAILDLNTDTASADTMMLQSPPSNFAFFVSKLNPLGQYLWGNKIWSNNYLANPLTQSSLAVDNGGNVFIVGSFSDSCHFGNITIRSHPNQFGSYTTNDGFISKLNANGHFLWAKQIGGGNQEYITSFALDPLSGGLVISGYLTNDTFQVNTITGPVTLSSQSTAIFICKLDSTGNFLWAKQFGDDSSLAINPVLCLDGNNNIYLAGDYSGPLDMGQNPGTNILYGSGMFICKLNSQADLIWSGVISKNSNSGLFFHPDITVDREGNVFTTGEYLGKTDFDPGVDTAFLYTNSALNASIFVCKWTSGGGFEWVKGLMRTPEDTFPLAFNIQNSAKTISVDGAGNVFTAGLFSGLVDFDPGLAADDTFILRTKQTLNGYVSKLSSQGDFRWAFQLKTPNSSNTSSAATLFIGDSGAVYCGGSAPSSVNFDPYGSYYLPKDGAFILKFHDTNATNGLLPLNINNGGLLLYPNPASTEIRIKNDNQMPMNSVTVCNVLGQVVFRQKIDQSIYAINVRHWAQGLYIVNVDLGNGKMAQVKLEIRR